MLEQSCQSHSTQQCQGTKKLLLKTFEGSIIQDYSRLWNTSVYNTVQTTLTYTYSQQGRTFLARMAIACN